MSNAFTFVCVCFILQEALRFSVVHTKRASKRYDVGGMAVRRSNVTGVKTVQCFSTFSDHVAFRVSLLFFFLFFSRIKSFNILKIFFLTSVLVAKCLILYLTDTYPRNVHRIDVTFRDEYVKIYRILFLFNSKFVFCRTLIATL